MKHQFELEIKSTTSTVVLSFNAVLRKWEAKEGAKVLARRKNVLMLVQALNDQPETEAA